MRHMIIHDILTSTLSFFGSLRACYGVRMRLELKCAMFPGKYEEENWLLLLVMIHSAIPYNTTSDDSFITTIPSLAST